MTPLFESKITNTKKKQVHKNFVIQFQKRCRSIVSKCSYVVASRTWHRLCMTPEKLISISPEHQDENEIKQSVSLIEQSWSLSDCNQYLCAFKKQNKIELTYEIDHRTTTPFSLFQQPKTLRSKKYYLILFHKENFLVFDRLIVSRWPSSGLTHYHQIIWLLFVSISSIFPRPTV